MKCKAFPYITRENFHSTTDDVHCNNLNLQISVCNKTINVTSDLNKIQFENYATSILSSSVCI